MKNYTTGKHMFINLFLCVMLVMLVSCSKESAKNGTGLNSSTQNGEKTAESASGAIPDKGNEAPPPPILNISPKYNKFKANSGVMEMSCSMTDSMKLTWWWDKNGEKEAMLLQTPKSKNMFIVDSTGTVSYDTETLEGVRQNSRGGAFGYLSSLSGVIAACESEVGKNDLIKKTDSRVILGKQSEGYEIKGASGLKDVKVWVYEGIPLLMEIDMGSKVIFEAKSLETNIKVDASKFSVPKGVKLAS